MNPTNALESGMEAAKQAQATWKARPHPFCPGYYCVARKAADGRSEHLLSALGPAAQIVAFSSRAEAERAAIAKQGSAA